MIEIRAKDNWREVNKGSTAETEDCGASSTDTSSVENSKTSYDGPMVVAIDVVKPKKQRSNSRSRAFRTKSSTDEEPKKKRSNSRSRLFRSRDADSQDEEKPRRARSTSRNRLGGIKKRLSSSGLGALLGGSSHEVEEDVYEFGKGDIEGMEQEMFLDNDAESTLEEIRAKTAEIVDQEKDMRRARKVHTDRALARYKSGNTVGAVMSMRKLKKFDEHQENLLSAVSFLRKLEDELHNHLTNYRNKLSMDGGFDPSDLHSGLIFDVEPFLHYEEEVGKIIETASDGGESHIDDSASQASVDDSMLEELAALASGKRPTMEGNRSGSFIVGPSVASIDLE